MARVEFVAANSTLLKILRFAKSRITDAFDVTLGIVCLIHRRDSAYKCLVMSSLHCRKKRLARHAELARSIKNLHTGFFRIICLQLFKSLNNFVVCVRLFVSRIRRSLLTICCFKRCRQRSMPDPPMALHARSREIPDAPPHCGHYIGGLAIGPCCSRCGESRRHLQ